MTNKMKKLKFLMFAMIAMLTMTFTACSSDDDDNTNPGSQAELLPTEINRAFSNKYPTAKVDSWKKKDSYYIVNFTLDKTRAAAGFKASAWFRVDGSWKMTESDDDVENLPEAIIAAFKASIYADWTIDDIDVVEREGMETIIVLELELGDNEVELYFSLDGTIIKEIIDDDYDDDEDDDDDDDDKYLPEVPQEIIDFLAQQFSGYIVIDANFIDGLYVVEMKFGIVEYELIFDANYKWLSSTKEIKFSELPDFIKDYIHENYPEYEIDDIKVVTTVEGTSFVIELEIDGEEFEIVLGAHGEIIKK